MADKLSQLNSIIKDVPLAKVRVSPNAQRDLRQARVDWLAKEFDPELLGYPVVSSRSGAFFVIDGQHRLEAVKLYLGDGWEKQNITCRVYSGLTERDEADMFDWLNNNLSVSSFDKFKVRVTAGRSDETGVRKITDSLGLKISRNKGAGCIGSTAALVRIYKRSTPDTLKRALRIAWESYGDPGLDGQVIDGLARVCERYNGALDDVQAIERLKGARGGIGSLMSHAAVLRKQTAKAMALCIGGAAVEIINSKRGAKKLSSWWAPEKTGPAQ